MSSERAANQARKILSDELFKKGVHGLVVDKVQVEAKETFGLVVLVSKSFRKQLPSSVVVSLGAKEVEVPIVVQRAPEFKPE